MSRVILFSLPEDLAHQLSGVLRQEAHAVRHTRSIEDAGCGEHDVAFVSGDVPDFCRQISLLRASAPQLPVVVVTRLPEAGRWLDALEAGAKDYCGAPFERVQVRWIMDTVCPSQRKPAAA